MIGQLLPIEAVSRYTAMLLARAGCNENIYIYFSPYCLIDLPLEPVSMGYFFPTFATKDGASQSAKTRSEDVRKYPHAQKRFWFSFPSGKKGCSFYNLLPESFVILSPETKAPFCLVVMVFKI